MSDLVYFFRMIITAVLVVQKFYNDCFFGNQTIAMLGGITLKELNALEVVFLDVLNFDINVSEEEYVEYKRGLDGYFSEPLNSQKLTDVRTILDGMCNFEALYASLGIDTLSVNLPPHLLQAMYI